ncbi:MAG: DUF6790 family protein [Halobacteriota archaeon]
MVNFDIAYLYIPISIIVAIVYLLIDKEPRTRHRVIGVFLLSFLVISIGISSLIGFVGHIFFADQIAANIGWAAGSPFQREVGFANLVIGILGITCIWLRGNYWIATVIATTIFLWGAAYGHIMDIIVHGNYAPGNAGGVLYDDILVPLITIVLLAAYVRTAKMVEKGM